MVLQYLASTVNKDKEPNRGELYCKKVKLWKEMSLI